MPKLPLRVQQRPLLVVRGLTERGAAEFTVYRMSKGLAELHVVQIGEHGFVNKGGGADHFMDRLQEGLAANKLLSKR
jgi:hypothetical protein